MGTEYGTLRADQVRQFLDHGYLVVKGCVERDLAQRWTDRAWQRLGYDAQDPTSWEKDIVWMYPESRLPVQQVSPRAWQAICAVVGGEDRVEDRVLAVEGHFSTINSFQWSDAFIVNLHRGADTPWQAPSARSGGWHKDGAFFRHFLTSREQALLTVLLWSDVAHQGGGTFIATDSVGHMARFLADHPEGVAPADIPCQAIVEQCSEFVEITGDTGDFIILHPFMLHASSQNVLGIPRFMSNPPIVLKEPLQLNRPDPADFSLLERATLHQLGVERLDFRPTAPYEAFWSEVDPGA
ncbi:MAG: hypothetical protein O2782_01370 [bacterium]|nr:hypothetical protein [bacterium]